MNYWKGILFLGVLLFVACSSEQAIENKEKEYPEIFNKVLEAHGGKATWEGMNTLRYTRGEGAKAELHTIDLKTRKSLIEVEGKYKLGSNGKDVWVGPHRDSFPGKSPRFTHNLHFYFVAIPFVFLDPGVNVKDGGKVESGGKQFHLINLTFGDNVGDAPEDQYNMYVDPQTFKVDFITYSVTYFDKTRATKYNALKYDWMDANGLLAPAKYTGYKWENEALGDQRYESLFSQQNYSKSPAEASKFDVPEGAYIDQ